MPETPKPTVALTRHSPERRRAHTPATLACGCCCCCCCCCLHTIGGVVGALTGSVLPIKPRLKPVDPDFPFPFRRDELDVEPSLFPPAAVYWLFVWMLSTIVAFAQFILNGASDPTEILVGVFIVIMTLPAIQLAASVFAFLTVVLLYSDKVTAMIRIGKITLWSVVGTTIGTLIMAALLGALLYATK